VIKEMNIERFILVVIVVNLLSCTVNMIDEPLLIDPNMEWFSGAIGLIDSDGPSSGYNVVTDTKNNIYVSGEYEKKLLLRNFALKQQVNGYNQGFIAKADENGNWLWAKNFNGRLPHFDATSMVVDFYDNVYIAGYPKDSLFVEDVQIDLPGNKHIFIAKFAPSGDLIWVKSAFIEEKSGALIINRLSINSKGVLYLSGNSTHTTHFGKHVIHGEKYREGYIATISSDGEWLSAEIIQHEDFDIWYVNDITIDNDDNVFFAGMTEYGEASRMFIK
jgi:hypothetical protein